jgi:hypothetical protein
MRTERDGTGSQYGLLFGEAPTERIHSGWTIDSVHFDTSRYAIACADARTTLDGLTVDK